MSKKLLLTLIGCFTILNASMYGQTFGCKHESSAQEEEVFNKNARAGASSNTTTLYTIPVMFEIYHRGEAIGVDRNLADQKINDVITQVNQRFAAQGSYGGTNANIRIELVKRNGNHEPSNGIKRFNTKNYQYQVQDFSDMQQYGNANYITIRTHDQFQAGIDGVASSGLGSVDVRYSLFNNINEAAIVIIHELGHVFSLKHTFQGSTFDTNTNTWSCASATNDGVSDTDPHKQNDTGCDPNAINSCTGNPFGTLLKNYMCYSGYNCTDRFTPLQITKMRNHIQSTYNGFANTVFLTAPTAAEYPAIPCTVAVPSYTGDDFYPNGIGNISISTDQGSFSTGGNIYPVIHGSYKNYGRTRPITVTRQTPIQFQATTWWSEKIKIYLDKNNDGVFSETTELLHTLTPTSFGTNPYDPLFLYLGFNQSITLPSDALTDTYLRMRVVTIITAENNTACNLIVDNDYGYGSVEDYSVFIKDNRPKLTLLTRPHPAQSINKGENGNIIYKVAVTTGSLAATIDVLTLKTTGTYAAGDVVNFKMYVNGMNSLSGATFAGSVSSTGGAGETLTFNQYYIPIPANSGQYLIFTADVNANAVTGRTIKVNGAESPNPIGIVITGTQPLLLTNNQTDISGTQTIGQANFQISGNVLNNNTNITGKVYASLIANSSIYKTVEVNNGAFNMGSVFDGTYMVVIHNTPEGSGTPSLPAGMVRWAGENLENNPNDAQPNGLLNLVVNSTTISQARVNALKTVTFRVSQTLCDNTLVLSSSNTPSDDVTSGTITKEANATSGTITATNKITGTANVTYRAGGSVMLNPGFWSDAGTVFKTESGGCN
jgi:hypothetical protein